MAQPQNLLYSKEHEWARLDGDVATVGITDYAQNALGDIVYVELPRVGKAVTQFGESGVVESVKASSELFTPIGGEITEVNGSLENDPSVVNRDPYGEGWLFKVKIASPSEAENLLKADAYEELTKE